MERTGIEVTLHRTVSTGQHTRADAVSVLFSATKGTGLGTVHACHLHWKRSSTGECHNRAGLPTLDNGVDPSRQVTEIPLATTEREKVDGAENKAMPLIEGRGAVFRTQVTVVLCRVAARDITGRKSVIEGFWYRRSRNSDCASSAFQTGSVDRYSSS